MTRRAVTGVAVWALVLFAAGVAVGHAWTMATL